MNGRHEMGLTPERLQLFIAGLSGMSTEEVRKAKLLFLRNEMSELQAIQSSFAAFGVAQGCFAIIPIFWPIIWLQRKTMSSALTLQKEQIRNALSVWRDDIGDEARQIERDLDSL